MVLPNLFSYYLPYCTVAAEPVNTRVGEEVPSPVVSSASIRWTADSDSSSSLCLCCCPVEGKELLGNNDAGK